MAGIEPTGRFSWYSATNGERAAMIRAHRPRGKFGPEQICELFNITPEGYARIMNGEDWSHEFCPPDVNYIR